jgi:hypothetical protein
MGREEEGEGVRIGQMLNARARSTRLEQSGR